MAETRIGVGKDKEVFVRPDNESLVEKQYYADTVPPQNDKLTAKEKAEADVPYAERPRFRFAQMYLREVLQLIPRLGLKFTKQILYDHETRTLVEERVKEISPLHQAVHAELAQDPERTGQSSIERELLGVLDAAGRDQVFTKLFHFGEVNMVDTYPRNYDVDKGGALLYFDDVSPWRLNRDRTAQGLLQKRYDRRAIEGYMQAAIAEFESDHPEKGMSVADRASYDELVFAAKKVSMLLNKLDGLFEQEEAWYADFVKRTQAEAGRE